MSAAPENLDALLTPPEAAEWLKVKLSWLLKRWGSLPGCITESREVKRFHRRTYLEIRLKTGLGRAKGVKGAKEI